MSAQDTLTITLTGRPPVKVKTEAWPIVAETSDHLYDGEYDFQSFRHSRAWLKVRQHGDGRTVVYGFYSYESSWREESSNSARRGRLLAAGDSIPEAIASVAGELDAAREDMGLRDHFKDAHPFQRLAQECIADLPAEELAEEVE